MKRHLLLFFAMLMATLSLSAATKTWSFEWNKGPKDAGAQGFYNFGTSFVEKSFYEAELNGVTWDIKSDGTMKYAYTATLGQTIGTPTSVSDYTELWTSGIAGKIKAVRVKAQTKSKSKNTADLSVKVNGVEYKCGDKTTAELTSQLAENEFKATDNGQEGKIVIAIKPTGTGRGTLHIKKIEVDYEEIESSVPAPLFSLASGSYDETQSVALNVEGAEAGTYAVFYTTDGSNPRVEGGTRKEYTKPISVEYTQQVKAVTKVGNEYSAVTEANYVIRRSPNLSFYKTAIELTSGDEGFADLINPFKVSPITYKSSAWDVCSVDKYGALSSSYVTSTQTVTISAVFAGNDEFKPQTVTMTVTVKAKAPLATPVLTPEGGTFNAPVTVTAKSDDANTVTLWYSTTATSLDEFENADPTAVNPIVTVVEGNTATINIKKSCTLYVKAMGYNTVSPTVTAQYVIDEPLKAAFSTDRSAKTLMSQNFDTKAIDGWTAENGWSLKNCSFSTIDDNDKMSAFCGYKSVDGTSKTAALTSPEFSVAANSKAEFYAYFSGVYLVWGSWKVNIINTETGASEQVFDAFAWAQNNAYTGPTWNKFSFPLDSYVGKKVKVQIMQQFDGEDLAVDGFAVVQNDPTAAEPINIFEGESIAFHDLSAGAPESVQWTFPGGDITASAETDPVVTYTKAGTYDVTLTVKRGEESNTLKREAFVIVSKKAPTALIGLPEEGYQSPFVGTFVPLNVPVTFRDLSKDMPTAWEWQFQHADKETSNEQNPTVTFVKAGTVSVGLKASNEAGSSVDQLNYAIQAGGAQYVWNIATEENNDLKKIELGFLGNYAGSNWLALDKFAEKYKAPLADATVDEVAVYFASTTTVSPDADITLTVNSVTEKGEPGEVLATASMKASELKYDAENVVATNFKLDKKVELKKGQEFFVVIGPFPNNSLEVSPYTSDDIAILCYRRAEGGLASTWHYAEDQDESTGQGLGTYQWFQNTDGPTSMAVAPIINYGVGTSGIDTIGADKSSANAPVAIYTIDGMKVEKPAKGGIYIMRYADGSSRKVMMR